MRDSWYYSVPEGQIGPITLQELKDILPNLPNAQDVYIWHDSLPDWIRAGDLAEIVANAKMPPPQEAQSSNERDEERNPQDAAPDAAWDPQSLEQFHPDPTLAISAPASTPAASGIAAVKSGRHYALVGILAGVVMVLLGGGVFYLGITGVVTWPARARGFTSQLVNASPGFVLFIVGLVAIWSSRRKVAVE
jgi:GYF domain 2